MTIITDPDDAKERLSFEIQSTVPPEVTDDEMEAILAKVLRAAVWTAAAAFVPGDVVIPATENGLRYVCTKAGTTGSTEPAWPTRTRGTVGDGGVVWEEAGAQYDLWDMDQAIYEGWKIKKAKAVIYIGSGDDGLAEVYAHCAEMAELSKPTRLA